MGQMELDDYCNLIEVEFHFIIDSQTYVLKQGPRDTYGKIYNFFCSTDFYVT